MERLTAGSTAAARRCLHIMRKIMIPPPNSRDPSDKPPYFAKKCFALTGGTYQLHLRTQKKCLIVGTHLVEAYVALIFWLRTCTYILDDVEARTCRSRGAHVACTRTYNGQGARK